MKNQTKKSLHIKSSRLMNSLFIGNFKAAFSGKWIEFQDFREYSYGDDARYIDWSASSREQSTIMRRYREEKQGNILCVLDIRESLNYENEIKKSIYLEVLDLLYHASKLSWESFGWYLYDSLWAKYIAPKKSPVWLHSLEKLSENYRKNTQALNLDFLLKNPMKRSVIFVISDSLNLDEKSCKLANMKHDIIFVHISSYFENTLQWEWISRLQWWWKWVSINLDDQEKRKKYVVKREQQLQDFSKNTKKLWIDSIFLNEKTSIFTEFLKLMKQRERV
jgi:uncharacterized protein (DUF58 family)